MNTNGYSITLADGTVIPLAQMSQEQLQEFMRIRRTRRLSTAGLDVVAYLHPTKGWRRGCARCDKAIMVETRDGELHDLRVH